MEHIEHIDNINNIIELCKRIEYMNGLTPKIYISKYSSIAHLSEIGGYIVEIDNRIPKESVYVATEMI